MAPSNASRRGAMACLAVWGAFNLVVIAMSERNPWPAPASVSARTQAAYPLIPLQTDENAMAFPVRLMRPVRTVAPAPLVVFLHGAGQRGSDSLVQLEGLPARLASPWGRSTFPCYVVAPQCPESRDWKSLDAELELLIEQILQTENVDRQRVYLTGVSMGGFGCWALAARRPDLFAAVLPVCGGGDVATASRLTGVPIWAVHGSDDQVVPIRWSRDIVDAVRASGGDPQLEALDGVDHNCAPIAYARNGKFLNWMFQQVRSVEAQRDIVEVDPAE